MSIWNVLGTIYFIRGVSAATPSHLLAVCNLMLGVW